MVTNLPRRFGKYELLELISVGGMAEVYLARYTGERGFQRILAIKKILPSLTEDPEFVRMFIDEGKIAGQLSHSNICQIYELGRFGDSHFIAMEYVWGKDLLQIQTRYRKAGKIMPFSQACFIISKLCEGLDYAHKKTDPHGRPMNIVHRDVSPQNVLISYEGEVKLIDFGIAKARDRSAKTAAGVLKGKFGYMSPEQVRGLRLDRRSDIFCLGILLYELITGQTLFDGETDFVVLEKVRSAKVIPPSRVNPAVPPQLEAVVMKALQRDPEDRYQWASEMYQDLQAFMMTQRPVYTTRMLAQWMQKTFAKEILKERERLQRYFGAGSRSAQQQPPPPPSQAAEEEEDLEGATVIDPDASIGPLEPVLDEQPTVLEDDGGAPLPPLAAIAEASDFDDEEPTTVSPTAAPAAGPGEGLEDQATIMLDDEDPQAQELAARMQALAAQAGPAPADQVSPVQPVTPPPRGAPEPALQPPVPSSQANLPPTIRASGATAPGRATPVPATAVRTGTSPWMVLLVALGVGLLGFAGGAFLMKRRLARSRHRPAPRAHVVLHVPHLEATVTVDGKPARVGADGMVVLRDLAPGSHTLVVEAPGYETLTRKFQVSEGQILALALNPPRRVTPGKLVVRTIPRELEGYVVVNGQPHDIDYILGPVPADASHKVRLEIYALGFQPFKKTFENVVNGTKSVEVRLVPTREPFLQVVSDPSGADVFVGDTPRCRTPCRLTGVKKGQKLEIVVAKDGYEMETRKVKVGKRARQIEFALLEKKAEPRRAPEEEPQPVAARQPRPPRARRARVRPQRPRARARTTRAVSPAPEPAARPAPRPARKSNCHPSCPVRNKGCLWVNSRPRSRVFVDGRNTGRNTPIFGARALKLRPGRHRVTLVTPQGKRYNFSVSVRACQVTKLVRSLK